jgi:hypothetical protein
MGAYDDYIDLVYVKCGIWLWRDVHEVTLR